MTDEESRARKKVLNNWLLLIWEDPQWSASAIKVNIVDNITRSMVLIENYPLFPADVQPIIIHALQCAERGIALLVRGINELDYAHQLTVAAASEVQSRQSMPLTSAT